MAEGVTSGRGRNGPWLQNAWLRVETRQDDGSISPVALDGVFRPLERALAFVTTAGGRRISFERADYDIQPHHDELGDGRTLTLIARSPRSGVTLLRHITLLGAQPYLVTRVGITNESGEPLRIASMHTFATLEGGRGRIHLASKPAAWRIYRNGWQSWAPTMSFGGAQQDARSRPPVLSPEEPQQEPGRFASDDVGVLYDPQSRRSLLVGSVTARDMLTQVFVDAPARALDARCLADDLAVAPGDTLWSERILVDVTGTPHDQLERYGDALGRSMGARVPAQTPSGWCSWYYFFTEVTEDDVVRNLRFLEEHRRELPIETVQIDDGYQADIGDWLTVNEKFPRGMAWLASEIKRVGYTPGIWVAPFLLAESSRSYAEHPEFVVRDTEGQPALAINNWQRKNYALDGSNPDGRAWLIDLFREICDGWGYDYVKIDFLFAAAIKGARRDPSATRVRAYRDALAAVREGVGDRRFILGCGSLMAPSVGCFDGNRIGPDVGPWWRFLTADERRSPKPRIRTPDDELSAETAIRNTMTRAWMHGRLWANDPDCVLVRADRTKLTLDEVRSLASVIALSAGMTLSSDDLEKVPPERLDILSMLLPPLPRSATPVDLLDRDIPERFEVALDRDFDPLRVVGLFNFDDEARDIRLDLPEGQWHAFELWDERYLGVVDTSAEFAFVPPHACRIVALRPYTGAPRVVGTNAHVGVGAIDITGQAYDAATACLRVELSPAGRRHRRVFVDTAGRPIASATFAGREAAPHALGPAWAIDLDVDGPGTLELRFETRS